MIAISVAVCTYNRAHLLPELVSGLRRQRCQCPYDILIIDNNSRDATPSAVASMAREPGPLIRYIREPRQGIVYARNRAIEECLARDYIAFIDDDEIPEDGWLEAAYHALHFEGADCVGGKIKIDFGLSPRPAWLDNEVAGFLGDMDYGPMPLWIQDAATPVWTGNIAYRMALFRGEENPLRFDIRYNRAGADIGGGEDLAMFYALSEKNSKIRYRPDMIISHRVEAWKLTRRYFLHLHYRAGIRKALHDLPDYPRKVLGVPPFMISQLFSQCANTLSVWMKNEGGALRQAMNAAHAVGMIAGSHRRWKKRAARYI